MFKNVRCHSRFQRTLPLGMFRTITVQSKESFWRRFVGSDLYLVQDRQNERVSNPILFRAEPAYPTLGIFRILFFFCRQLCFGHQCDVALHSGETVCPLSDPDFDKFLICGHLCLSWASLKILVSILIVLRVKCSNHVAFETGQEKLMCLWLALQFLTFLVLWPMLKHCNHYTGLGFQLLISVVSLVEIVLATYWPLDVKYFVKS